MLVGRRTNVAINEVHNATTTNLFTPQEVHDIAVLKGRLIDVNAQDYFIIYKNSFPWHAIPDVVIGRVAYDNFIVAKAIGENVSVIDVTKTVVAMHQTDSEGNKAGHQTREKDINKKIIGKYNFGEGKLENTPYLTVVTNVGQHNSSNENQMKLEHQQASREPSRILIYRRCCRSEV